MHSHRLVGSQGKPTPGEPIWACVQCPESPRVRRMAYPRRLACRTWPHAPTSPSVSETDAFTRTDAPSKCRFLLCRMSVHSSISGQTIGIPYTCTYLHIFTTHPDGDPAMHYRGIRMYAISGLCIWRCTKVNAMECKLPTSRPMCCHEMTVGCTCVTWYQPMPHPAVPCPLLSPRVSMNHFPAHRAPVPLSTQISLPTALPFHGSDQYPLPTPFRLWLLNVPIFRLPSVSLPAGALVLA